jgi:hypothetical protein
MIQLKRLGTVVLLAATLIHFGCSSSNQAKATIDSSGGSVAVREDGPVIEVGFPKGALSAEAKIKLTRLETRPHGAAGPAIEIEPHGTVFDKPVTLRFQVTPEDLVAGADPSRLRVAAWDGHAWELLPTRLAPDGAVEGCAAKLLRTMPAILGRIPKRCSIRSRAP